MYIELLIDMKSQGVLKNVRYSEITIEFINNIGPGKWYILEMTKLKLTATNKPD